MQAQDAEGMEFQAALAAAKRYMGEEEFGRALPHCVKATEMRPDEQLAHKCHTFALLNLSKWADALQVCDKQPDGQAFAFERAYCLYRLNRFKESLEALGKVDKADSGAVRLEAQVRYRMGDYEKCAKMYEDLYADDADDTGLLVNALASTVSGDNPSKALSLMADREDLLEDSYELSFNLACALIDANRLSEAEDRLRQAKEICAREIAQAEEIEADDVEALEDHEELAAIHVQRACVLQRKGATDEASDIYSRVLRPRSGDAGEVDVTVLAVACNNVVTLRSEGKSLFDSLKRINIASKESLEHKLTRRQTIEIGINKSLLLLQARKGDEAKRELQRLKDIFPGHPRVAILQAACSYSEKKTKACEEALQAYIAEHPGEQEVLVSLAQLYTQQNRVDKAVEALAQLPVAHRAQPRTLETIVALYQKQRNTEKALACVRETVDYWTGKDAPKDEAGLGSILRTAARLAKRLKGEAVAAEVYQLYLERVDGSDVEALCELVKALANTDVKKAEQFAGRLRVADYGHFDAEELEQAPIPKIVTTKKKDGAAGEGADAGADEKDIVRLARAKAKRAKKKAIRWPKGFDPENPGPPPDPERWLPKRERAEFKKRMRKRDKNLARGPQGTMPVDDTAFRKAGPSTAQVQVTSEAPTRGKPRNQGKKGKR